MSPYRNPPELPPTGRRLESRVILVTGASSGIGAAAARRFAAEGGRVVAFARRRDRLEKLAELIGNEGGEAMPVEGDVDSEDSIREAIAATIARFGRLDGAFNNAGMLGAWRPFHELDSTEFDAIVRTNLRGTFLSMKYEIIEMLRTGGGSIVNTSSIAGLVGGHMYADYSATKFGMTGLVKCAAIEYAQQGIRVNAVAPGPTATEMFEQLTPTEDLRNQMAAMTPMNFLAHPDDIARAALYLLSDESRWTTGVVLPCEGGFSAQ